MRCSVEEEEEQIIAHFLGTLKPEIADIVHLQQYWTQSTCYTCFSMLQMSRCGLYGEGMSKQTTGHFGGGTDPVYDTEGKDESDGEEIEVVYADHGNALFTKRVLNVDVEKQ
uniref:Uncharacterized protein n=1 Tax=Lactuca sativa TaxID=4236 RepID=A0A9R1WHR8_LACSA|nr:hypothetical protein LSAT_V11C200051640 [Lactuca sativa]